MRNNFFPLNNGLFDRLVSHLQNNERKLLQNLESYL